MNREAERNRLVELLIEYDTRRMMRMSIEECADHLLDNGVVVPPCRVGDKVYVIEPCTCYNNYSEYDKCHHRRTKATKWIEMVRVPTKHYTKCLKLFERPFRIEYFNKIGKTVFLTREEAEKALEGKEDEGK